MFYIGGIHCGRKLSKEEIFILINNYINEYYIFAFRNLVLYLLLVDKN